MAECFCGCGRKVGFKDRGLNKQGRRTAEQLQKLREARQKLEAQGPLVEGGDSGPLLGTLEEMIVEGEVFGEFWARSIHTGRLPPPGEALRIKREWTDWGKRTFRTLALLDLPPEQLVEVIRRGTP